jgi:hypothetical protein
MAAVALMLVFRLDCADAAEGPSDVAGRFEQAVSEYMTIHRQVERTAPPLEVSDDPQKIREAVEARAAGIRTARSGAKQGDLFTPEIGSWFRSRLARAVAQHGYDATDVVEWTVEGVDGEWQPLVINSRFTWGRGWPLFEFMLEVLPELPEELEYRFVDRDLVLLDLDAGIVVDILPSAVKVPWPSNFAES